MTERHISMTTSQRRRKRTSNEKYFRFVIILCVVMLVYMGMKDYLLEELIIPQLNISVSAVTFAIVALLLIFASLVISDYINKLLKAEDWVLAVSTPLVAISSVKLMQYNRYFAAGMFFFIGILLILICFVWVAAPSIRRKNIYGIERAFNLVNIIITSLGLVTSFLLIKSQYMYLKTDTVDKYIAEQTEKYSDEYIEYISRFHPDKWEELSYDEKLETVCFLVKYEEEERGINTVEKVNIVAENNNVLAYYNYQDKTIAINETYFLTADSYSIMDSVLHEFFHSWQHYVVNEYNTLDDNGKRVVELVSDVDKWPAEFGASYVDGSQGVDNFMNYYGQDVEESAREYGEERCAEYKEEIEKLVNSDMY